MNPKYEPLFTPWKIGNVEMTGMVLACVVAMAMSLVFYIFDKFGLTNDQPQK